MYKNSFYPITFHLKLRQILVIYAQPLEIRRSIYSAYLKRVDYLNIVQWYNNVIIGGTSDVNKITCSPIICHLQISQHHLRAVVPTVSILFSLLLAS